MMRVLLDTNIYGEIVRRGDTELVKRFVENKLGANIAVYGNSVIRKELRDVPKKTQEGRRARLAVLTLYDLLVGSHSFEIAHAMYELANSYVSVYKELKGQLPRKKSFDEPLYNDFLIIASATLKVLDIVYSGDEKTMYSEEARKAYKIVNDVKKLRTPNFESYDGFIKEIKRWLPL